MVAVTCFGVWVKILVIRETTALKYFFAACWLPEGRARCLWRQRVVLAYCDTATILHSELQMTVGIT